MESNDFALGMLAGQDDRNGYNGADGMMGGQWVWAFLIIALLFRGGLFGGNADGNGALTRSDLCEGFNFNNLENGVRGVQQGLCDGFYAMNTSLMNGFHGVDNSLCAGFNAVNGNITQARFDNQQCCCETQRLIERGFCDVIQANNQNTQRIVDMYTQDKMESLREQLQAANFQLSQQAQTANLINQLRPCPVPAYPSCSPYTSYSWGDLGRNGCGCW